MSRLHHGGTERHKHLRVDGGGNHVATAEQVTVGSADEVDLNSLIAASLALEILPDKLYFTSLAVHPSHTETTRFFTVDHDLPYTPYFADFGPLNICQLVRFSRKLNEQLAALSVGQRILFYTSHHGHQRANAACLVACYALICHGHSPASAAALLRKAYPPFLPFRDASFGVSTFNLTIHDVLCGLHKAIKLGWFDLDKFDVDEYEHYERLECGDWNWIVPGQFIGFSSPVDDVKGREAKNLVKPFRERGVAVVVRLNESLYDKKAFTEVGIRHVTLHFEDGSVPPDNITAQFLQLVEKQTHGVIAVHCKAGLGRTGTMIGLYCIKHFGFTAREYIAWARLCRPGSVIGPQQQFLESAEKRLTKAGDVAREAQLASAVRHGERSEAYRLHVEKKSGGCPPRLPPTSLPHATPLQLREESADLSIALFDPSFTPAKMRLAQLKYNSSQELARRTPPTFFGPARSAGNSTFATAATTGPATDVSRAASTLAMGRSFAAASSRPATSMDLSTMHSSASAGRSAAAAPGALQKNYPLRCATPTATEMTLGPRSRLVGTPADVVDDLLPPTSSPALRVRPTPLGSTNASVPKAIFAKTATLGARSDAPWLSGTVRHQQR